MGYMRKKSLLEKPLEKNELKNKNRTSYIIFQEIQIGLGELYLSIVEYYIFLISPEFENEKNIRDSTEGELLKENINQWIKYVQDRINELENKIESKFKKDVLAPRWFLINLNSKNINEIIAIEQTENYEILQQCISYIGLIKDLNKIINKHNTCFQKLDKPEQEIDFLWDCFHLE
jgi:hypothetical protein